MNAIIIYSTLDGHNLEMGLFLRQKLLASVPLISTADFAKVQLADYDLLVLCPCTYGEGQLTETDQLFYNALGKYHLPDTSFLVIGIGDKAFGPHNFANAATLFARQLQQTGATPIVPPLKVDYEEVGTARKRAVKVITKYYQKKGLPLSTNTHA